MTDFLLELRSEEIPARMQDDARQNLKRLFEEQMADAGLKAAEIVTFATPRRLALIAYGLPLETQAVREELKGPKTSAPPQALEGFLRKTGLTQDQLVERDGVWFAIIEKAGRKTTEVLHARIPLIVWRFPWPKSMRWGQESRRTDSLRWVRPIQSVIAILGDEVVPINFDVAHVYNQTATDDLSVVQATTGLVAGRETVGHRFHSQGLISISNASTYAAQLRATHVILDQEERRAIIRAGAEKAATDAGLVLVPDERLVNENSGLTEWPVPMLGRFDPAFLSVPEEVIQLTARVNQKYFICRNGAGTLANAFICTANIEARDGGAAIVAGNEKVLAARLSDAKFFWEQDLKVPLDVQAEKLSNIVFHEKLGTVADKVERVAKLARWLVETGVVKSSPGRGGGGAADGGGAGDEPLSDTPLHRSAVPLPASGEELAKQAERAARLCKADLVTGMVGEFPELQGIMGGYYARAQGEDDAVADAIRDHYKPVGQGDDVPTAPVTVAVSLADKLDTLISFFAIDERPSGSKDPFALRRSALGIISLLVANRIALPLSALCEPHLALLAYQISGRALAQVDCESAAEDVYSAWKEGRDFGIDDNDTPYIRNQNGGSQRYGSSFAPSITFAIKTHNWILACGPALLPFLADRLKVQQREAGVRHDLIDAVFALGGEDDLVRLLARVKALQAFVGTDEGKNLLAGYKRAANILKQNPSPLEGEGQRREAAQGEGASVPNVGAPNPSPGAGAPSSPSRGEGLAVETALLNALEQAETLATAAIERENFADAMAALASLRAPIDAFFDGVMVNDPDPDKRSFRIGLLTRFRDAVHRVADFSKIEG